MFKYFFVQRFRRNSVKDVHTLMDVRRLLNRQRFVLRRVVARRSSG